MPKTYRKLNNKGFSLVELIVVILIMAILTSGITIAISLVTNARCESAARKLAAVLEQTRVQTINNQDAEVVCTIAAESNGDVYASIWQKDQYESSSVKIYDQKVGNSFITVTPQKWMDVDGTYQFVAGSPVAGAVVSGPVTSAAVGINITFDAGSGAFSTVTTSTDELAGIIDGGYSDIQITGQENWNIILIRETGRVLVEEID